KILTALRSSEVASDPSNILLLLSVQKSKTSESNTIQLCTVQRVVRTNFFVSEINTPHFILFSSTSLISSSEKEEIAFSAYKNLKTSYAIYQKLFPGSEILFSIKKRSNKPWLADGLVEQFKANQCLPFHVSHQDHPYYEGVQIKTLVRDGDQELEVADAGFTDWARKITGKKDLYYFIHGIGMDRLLSLNSFHESGA
ncbi:MAG TPA: hypothetical protein VNS32_22525, partial [Flavisolibacter sp.]|nr:hypothetical protein [Flavisolibacter sp.]